MFEPKYKITNQIIQMLTAIAEAKAIIERARLLPKHELKLRRQALLRMTHSSTAIEGNRLNMREVEAVAARKKVDAPEREIYEVKNYLEAIRYIEKVVKNNQPITEKIILQIHRLVTDKTLPAHSSGQYRKGPVYVVRRWRDGRQEVLYTAAGAGQVPGLMAGLTRWLAESETQNISPVIVAGIAHQEIAAIHPFADGNGRTARALATLILYRRGYDFRRLFALEDFYNEDRPSYYRAINVGKNYQQRRVDFTPWLEYFVRGFKEEIIKVKNNVLTLSAKKVDKKIEAQIYLDKDQLKILEFADQMGKISVGDVVDILSCPKRTAQSYLQKLKKLKIIRQVGKGPASGYIIA
ncbi:Fic family protein [Patescibacteria group bacterium]|nr:MAG: Fic family protein [Patescibacteria group bacterium]